MYLNGGDVRNNLKMSSIEKITIVIISNKFNNSVVDLLKFGRVSTEKENNDNKINSWMNISNLLPILESLSITNFIRKFFT